MACTQANQRFKHFSLKESLHIANQNFQLHSKRQTSSPLERNLHRAYRSLFRETS